MSTSGDDRGKTTRAGARPRYASENGQMSSCDAASIQPRPPSCDSASIQPTKQVSPLKASVTLTVVPLGKPTHVLVMVYCDAKRARGPLRLTIRYEFLISCHRLSLSYRGERNIFTQKLEQGRTKSKRVGSHRVDAKPGMKPLVLRHSMAP